MPEKLYKYMSSNGARRFLENHCIWFSDPLKYNDPYEGAINVLGSVSDENKYRFIKDTIEPDLRRYGVTCFSSDGLSMLMWAYYAENQRGCNIEFNTCDDTLLFADVHQVRYSPNLPEVKMGAGGDTISLLTTKSNKWSHENEFRAIKTGYSDRLFTVNPLSINSITIGCNAAHFYTENDENIQTYLDIFFLLQRPEYANVKIKQVQLDIKSYNLRSQEVPFFVYQKGDRICVISFKDQHVCVQTAEDQPKCFYDSIARKWESVELSLPRGAYYVLNDDDPAIHFNVN